MRAIKKDKAITNTNMYNKYVVDTTSLRGNEKSWEKSNKTESANSNEYMWLWYC